MFETKFECAGSEESRRGSSPLTSLPSFAMVLYMDVVARFTLDAPEKRPWRQHSLSRAGSIQLPINCKTSFAGASQASSTTQAPVGPGNFPPYVSAALLAAFRTNQEHPDIKTTVRNAKDALNLGDYD